MRNSRCFVLAALAVLVVQLPLSTPLVAQPPDNEHGAEREADFHAWQWHQQVHPPAPAAGRYAAFDVPPSVFGAASPNLNDLRLGDATGARLPYALRVLRKEQKQQDVRIVHQFNAGPVEAGYYQVTLELQDTGPPGYNDITIDTPGEHFARKVEVYGADNSDFKSAPNILHGGNAKSDPYLIHYDTERGVVDIRRLRFGYQRYRFLQVRVYRDVGTQEAIPTINAVTVRRTIAVAGAYRTEPAQLGVRNFVRGEGGPGTAWFVDLGVPMPCERLTLQVAGEEVNRPFRLEIANPNEPRQDLGGIDWKWRKDPNARYLEASFAEVTARRFRLVVTDFDNPPLNILGAQYTSCVRQIVFETAAADKLTPPVWLYYGNPQANAPHYDLERKLPAVLQPQPVAATLDEQRPNPDYQPPPQSLSQRMPWLVYVVLGAACAVLLGILAQLARHAIARSDAAMAAMARVPDQPAN